MIIRKFGGTSVGSIEALILSTEILKNAFKTEGSSIVVVSAMAGVTNQLISSAELAENQNTEFKILVEDISNKHVEVCQKLLSPQIQSNTIISLKLLLNELEDILQGVFYTRELTAKVKDLIVSYGEKLSSTLFTALLLEKNVPAQKLNPEEFIICGGKFGKGLPNWNLTQTRWEKLQQELSNKISVVPGFFGGTQEGFIITLGRGGSDFTASILGYLIPEVKEIQIWTDVDGFLTADPRKVPQAKLIQELSYLEAMELAHFGAKVIYPPTIQPAIQKEIPIRIKNTFNSTSDGTLIIKDPLRHQYEATGITSIAKVGTITIQGSGLIGISGMAGRVFKALAIGAVNVLFISQASSETTISIAVSLEDLQTGINCLKQEFEYEIDRGLVEQPTGYSETSILSVVGDQMKNHKGLAGRIFSTLGKNGINLIGFTQGSNERNISCLISENDLSKALGVVHQNLFQPELKEVNIVLIGVGLIGSTLLAQIKNQRKYLLANKHLSINLIGLANSKKMVLNHKGLSIENYKGELEAGEKSDIKVLLEKLVALSIPNTVVVDCTSGEVVIPHYEKAFEKGISVVTANKIANSSSLAFYQHLKQKAIYNNVSFLYETNVGAGLPIIGTLQNLIQSGDEIFKIQAILSGTLSYLFNTYNSSSSFAEVVKQAKHAGYTEPDPRDDLNGKDMARKALILAREAGWSFEMEDILISPILNADCLNAKSVDEFFDLLEADEPRISKLYSEAAKKGNRIRFIADISKDFIGLSLKEVDRTSPFYELNGAENMINFKTFRYNSTPLVIRGPGAGAEVTAGGVFADIVSTL